MEGRDKVIRVEYNVCIIQHLVDGLFIYNFGE